MPDLASTVADVVETSARELARQRGIVIMAAPRTLVIANRASFRDYVRQRFLAEPVGVVIDCTAAEYIDSSGVALLFALAKDARRAGIGYCVSCLSADLRALVNLTRIDTVVPMTDALHEGILAASLGVPPGEIDTARSGDIT